MSSCTQQPRKIIQNNFCEIYEPLKKEPEDVAKYFEKIKIKMKKKEIKTVEERFAEFTLNHIARNNAKYVVICIDKNAIKKFKDKK